MVTNTYHIYILFVLMSCQNYDDSMPGEKKSEKREKKSMKFKQEHTLEQRQAESSRIRSKC